MTNVVKRPLPHSVAPNEFANQEVRRIAQLLMENIKSIKRQLEEVQSAIEELRRRS